MVIFEGYGIEIILRNNSDFIRYDAGWMTIQYEEFEITKEEAELAQQGENEAYKVILQYQNKKRGLV